VCNTVISGSHSLVLYHVTQKGSTYVLAFLFGYPSQSTKPDSSKYVNHTLLNKDVIIFIQKFSFKLFSRLCTLFINEKKTGDNQT